MEDVLDVYKRPRDEEHPVVCADLRSDDECPKQLIGETRTPLPAEPGRPECFDTEYIRREPNVPGTGDIFMFVAPLEGWRRAEITEQRTCIDWANQIKKLVAVDFADAKNITLVMDNLNTHGIASLYKAFLPEEANSNRRFADPQPLGNPFHAKTWPLSDRRSAEHG
jgi:hypothetical protein